MKKSIVVLLSVLMALVLLPAWGIAFAEASDEWVEVTAGSSPFFYSDSLLMMNEYQLDPDIAKISAALSKAAYSSSTTSSMLTQMGFTTIESHYDATYTFDDCDHVGYTIAKKASGDYTIYCIPIRGTPTSRGGELLEWVSDLNMSIENGYHMGFGRAADEVMADLMAMINADGNSSDKRIIWLTGHSRGAAVANIIAGKLTAANQGHVFGYTFACPYVYSGNAPAYANIYNFNFVNDFVPQLPLASWGFTRYGIDGTKDIASWAESIMTKNEVDTLLNTLDSAFVPDSAITKLFFGLLSWGMIEGDSDDLRKILDDITDDPDAFVYLVTNKYGIDETIVTLKTEYISMLNFWDDNYQAMSEIPDEDWAAFRSLEGNTGVFALYDKVAGSTVSSYAQLLNLIPIIESRNAAANSISSLSDVLSLFFDTNWEVKALFEAHDSAYYVKWMNQKYWGYQGCKGNNYEDVEIAINARTISPNCFENATGSFTVNMENVEVIGKYAFSNCSGLTGAEWGYGVQYVGAYAFQNCTNMGGTARLGEGMTSLPSSVFSGCTGLEEIIIPDSVETIGIAALDGCSGLKKVTMPLSCQYNTEWSSSGSFDCYNVEELVFTAGNGTVWQAGYVYEPYYSGWAASVPAQSQNVLKKVTFAEGVTALPEDVLYGCSAVTEVVLPSTLTSVSAYAFYNCSSLAKITIPSSTMPAVGSGAFYNCKPTVHCHFASEVDAWAQEQGYSVVYLEALAVDMSDACDLLPGVTVLLDSQLTPKMTDCLTWYSTDENVATVQNNVLTTHGIGSATITVHFGDELLDEMVVTVVEGEDPHRWGSGVLLVVPGCVEEGLRIYPCESCEIVKAEVLAPRHLWDRGLYLTEQTCTDSGEKLFTCQTCGENKTETVPPHHWYNGVLTTWPSAAPGEMSYACVYCEEVKLSSVNCGLSGDANEDDLVDMLDVIDLMEWYCGGIIELNIANGEVTGDTCIDMLDIITLLKWYCGEDVTLTSNAGSTSSETSE